MNVRRVALALLVAPVACTGIDTSELAPIDDYRSWDLVRSETGDIPGHGDTVRDIYVNDVGRSYSHAGRYQPGSILIKEIYGKNGDGSKGDLSYVAVMRKVADDAELDAPVEGGWVFTQLDAPGGSERYFDLCWATCHRQGPVDYAWFDYGE